MMMKRNYSMVDFDSLFNSFFFNFPTESKPPLAKKFVYDDSHDITETVLQIALAGYSKEDVKVWIEGREIHIEGSNEENEKVLEKFRNSFNWKVPVGEQIDLKKTDVKFESGLLTIRIPMKQPDKRKTFLMGGD